MKENLFMDSLKSYRGSKRQKIMGLVKEVLLKKKTESTIVAAQDQTLHTSNMRNAVYGENVQSICHVCRIAVETVALYCFRMLKTSAEGEQTSET